MLQGFKSETRKEIFAAKKILYEGESNTKQTFLVLLASLISLVLLFVLCFVGTTDTWECEVDSTNSKHEMICRELRKAVSCKTVSGPIRAEVLLSVAMEDRVKASALVICPWEMAISEIRVCFCLIAVLVILIGLYAIRRESKKYADLCYQGALFLGVALAISSYFDWLSIRDSIYDNEDFCTLSNAFRLETNVKGERLDCSYTIYYATVLVSSLSAASMFYSAYKINDWRSKLIVDIL